MDEWNSTVSDVVSLLKSWIPWRGEPTHVSRDFWMPDQSCIVCYECDSQFTLFNRRHHCRHCGRIFCAKCTSNSVHTRSRETNATREEWDKVRVCNYCFRQWEQCSMPHSDDGILNADVDASNTSISVASFLSTRSSITCDSGGIPCTVLPRSVGLSSHQSSISESLADRQSFPGLCTSNHSIDGKDITWSQHERAFLHSRSDIDDEEFETPHFGSVTSHFSQENGYYDHGLFDDANCNDYFLQGDHDEDATNSKDTDSPVQTSNFCSQIPDEVAREGVDNDIGECESETPSSIYVAGGIDIEPVDFENNGVLWLPPDPDDDEEDEGEVLPLELEDGNNVGKWGCTQSSRSSGSGESRNNDKYIEEHNRVMKNVLDGHFRALIAQLLQVENLLTYEEDDSGNWLETITALCWEAATLLKPDTSKSGQMDPVGYVKVMCVPSGRRRDSTIVQGVVCKKNVALKQMTSKIERPRLLILGGALEYQRVPSAYSSIDTLLQQEMDHLKMAVAKLSVHNPNVVLVEKSVSRCAQEYLLAKNISLALNVKRPILERISRCTGAQIVSSVDYLSSPKLGTCDLFHVERVLEDHGAVVQSGHVMGTPLMFFEGCPKPLSFTVLLKGAPIDELKKIKHVISYGIFAAYHLALETCFLADEGVSLPDLSLNSPIIVALPEKLSTIHHSISVVPDFTLSTTREAHEPQSFATPTKEKISSLIKSQEPKAVVSPCSTVAQNSSMMRKYSFSKYDGHQLSSNKDHLESDDVGEVNHVYDELVDENAKNLHFRYLDSNNDSDSSIVPHYQMQEVADQAAVGEEFPHSPTENQQAVTDQPTLHEEFPPSPADNQSILVSLSSRCVWKGTVCDRSHIFRIKYYGNNDRPLGRFLRDYLFDQNYRCSSCQMPAEAHVQCYTHRQGSGNSICTVNNSDYRSQITVLEGLLQDEKSKFEAELQKIMHKGQSAIDILELNQLRQQLILQSYIWDQRIRCATNLDVTVQDDSKIGNNEVVLETTPSRIEENFSNSDSDATNIKHGLLDSQPSDASRQCSDIVHTIGDAYVDSRHGTQSPLVLSTLVKFENDSDPLVSGIKVRRALSDGQAPICISDTLDAAWIGESQPVAGNLLDNSSSKPNELDTTSMTENRLEVENRKEDFIVPKLTQSPSIFSTKSGDYFNEPMSWLGTSFLSFYRSYKNLLGARHKLDTISEYDPVYISSYRESEPRGVGCFFLPVGVNDIVIPVYEDEPTSVISYTLISSDYLSQVSDEHEFIERMQSIDGGAFQSFNSSDEKMLESFTKSLASIDEGMTSSFNIHNSLPSVPHSYLKTSDATVQFVVDGPSGKVKHTCTCYYAKRFKALREVCCPSEVNYVRSLSRCKKWGAQGGKSNVFFAKTLDDRFIVKQVTKTELESFIKFAPSYFKYLTDLKSSGNPTCLAKILGVYQVASKQVKGGKETKMDLLVMENLLFERNVTRLYDLKGSSRSRFNPDTSGSNKVLLDQNLIEAMPTSPIFVGNKAKKLLERAVWNDTAFLDAIDVMDYSLLVGVDEEKHELVLGIIDFMRQYTWDKHLETWVKASGILGGPKNASPTVISPKQYKKRFRKAMSTYFLVVPDQWSPPSALVPNLPPAEIIDNSQNLQIGASVE